MTEIIDRVPPQSQEAEASALGAMLLEAQAIDTAMALITPSDFYQQRHQHLCTAIYAMRYQHVPVDVITLGNYLRENELDEQTGGALYLMDLMHGTPTAAGITQYCHIIRRMAQRRGIITAADRMMHAAYTATPAEPVVSLLANAQSSLEAIGTQAIGEMDIRPLWQWETALMQEMQSDDARGYETGLRTGIPALDQLLDPLQAGDMLIVAGRPSMGKSVLAAQIAIEAAALHEQFARVLFLSVEMSEKSVAARYMQYDSAMENPAAMKTISGRQQYPGVYQAIERAIDRHKGLDIDIGKPRGLCAQQIVHAGRRKKQTTGLDLVVVDYLQLMHANSRHKDRYAEITAMSIELKEAATALKVPLVCVSQLSREVEKRPIKVPMLSDLKESGQIEQDADGVVFLYRPGYYGPQEWLRVVNNDREQLRQMGIDENDKTLTQLIVAKQRNGPTGEQWARFDMPRSRFAQLDYRRQPAC